MKLKSWQHRWSIANLLYVSFVFMILLPIVFVTWFSVRSFDSVLLNHLTLQAMQTLEQVSYTMDSAAMRISLTAAAIANDEKIMATATKLRRADDQQKSYETGLDLDHQLDNYLHNTTDIVSVVIANDGNEFYWYKQQLQQDQTIKETMWYKQTMGNRKKVQLFGMQQNYSAAEGASKTITAAINPGYDAHFYDVNLIYFIYRGGVFQQLLHSRVDDSGEFIVSAENGSVVSASSDQIIEQGTGAYPLLAQALTKTSGKYVAEFNGEKSLVLFMTSEQTGWKYIHTVPYSQLLVQVDAVYTRTMVVATIGLLIFLGVSFVLVRSITRPIRNLFLQMKRVKLGDMGARIVHSGPAEIYMLGASFNEMILRIQELIKEQEIKEAQKMRAEMDALQSQINPHFLVNTLNSIKIMAMMTKAGPIELMTESLMKLLYAAFNQGGSYTTVTDEVQLLEHYFTIMKTRFGNRFQVTMEMDESILNGYMLKLLLQPIAENAIVHGFHDLEGQGEITIKGKRQGEDKVVFTIMDNGNGMDETSIQRLLSEEPLEHFSGIGVSNVLKRIQLNYGTGYGLTLVSRANQGTMVTLVLPYLKKAPQL